MAEAVEKVGRVKIFETKIQNPGQYRINVASYSGYRNDSCTKSVGFDFFNSLSQNQTQDSLSGRAVASIRSGMSKPSFDQP